MADEVDLSLPLSVESKDKIMAEAREARIASKAIAQKAIKTQKSAALGIASAAGKSAAAASTASPSAPKPSASAAKASTAKTPSSTAKAPSASGTKGSPKPAASTGKPSPSAAKGGASSATAGAKKKAAAAQPRGDGAAAPAAAEAAPLPPALSDEDRELERARKAAERDAIRAEMQALILAEEERIRRREEERRAREKAQRALEAKLLEAAFDGELEVIETQLRAWQAACGCALIGAKLEFKDPSGHTMLSEAAVAGHARVAAALLGAGADVNTRNSQGRTPLWRAAFQGHAEAARLLLAHGADPRLAATDAETPAMVASQPALKAELSAWDVAETDRLLAALAERAASQWTPPPPDPRDASVPIGQPGHCAQIIIQRFADVLEEVTLHAERYLLVVDLSGKALTFLQYRDVNLINWARPADVSPEAVRRSLVGALRYGKPLVVDFTLMAEATLELLDDLFEPVLPGGGLRDLLLERAVLRPEVYARLLREHELADAQSDLRLTQWRDETTANFCLVVMTRNPLVSEAMAERFFVLKCA